MVQLQKNSSDSDPSATVKRPVHQTVYEDLRDRILFGELTPGQAVTIQGLCDSTGAGMTPVREAIRRLIAEGALQLLGNRRVLVPTLTSVGLQELNFMRQSLEGELTRRSTPRLAERQLEHLTQIDTELNSAISHGDIHGYLKQNYRFHITLYDTAESPIILATVARLWLRFGPSLRVVCGRYGTMNLPDKHAELLTALKVHDAEAAVRAVREDIEQGMSQIGEVLSPAIAAP